MLVNCKANHSLILQSALVMTFLDPTNVRSTQTQGHGPDATHYGIRNRAPHAAGQQVLGAYRLHIDPLFGGWAGLSTLTR